MKACVWVTGLSVRASWGKDCVLFGLTERGLKTWAHFEFGGIPVVMSSVEKDVLKSLGN